MNKTTRTQCSAVFWNGIHHPTSYPASVNYILLFKESTYPIKDLKKKHQPETERRNVMTLQNSPQRKEFCLDWHLIPPNSRPFWTQATRGFLGNNGGNNLKKQRCGLKKLVGIPGVPGLNGKVTLSTEKVGRIMTINRKYLYVPRAVSTQWIWADLLWRQTWNRRTVDAFTW